jgi:hypothetical protein
MLYQLFAGTITPDNRRSCARSLSLVARPVHPR